MFQQGSTSGSFLFTAIRLSPLLSSVILGALSQISDYEVVNEVVGRFLILASIMVVWSMAEGTVMLWDRAKKRGLDSARGYAITCVILAIALLALLTVLRSRTSQTLFVITLIMLSLRGMSRAAWEQGRLRTAWIGAALGGTLLAFISFFTLSLAWNWQQLVFASAIGIGVSAVEASWFGALPDTGTPLRWRLPVFRMSVIAAPIIVATMALSGVLPRIFVASYLLVPLCGLVTRRCVKPETDLRPLFPLTAALYLAFAATVVACHYYGVWNETT